MLLISGLVVMALAIGFFIYSLPRGGKVALFVGGKWEGYVVVIMIGAIGVGLMLTIMGTARLVSGNA